MLEACLIANPSWAAISIEQYIDPGAGLSHMQDWPQDSDFIFDSLFVSGNEDLALDDYAGSSPGMSSVCAIPAQPIPMVRTYKNDAAM